jgi:hypothetical protein
MTVRIVVFWILTSFSIAADRNDSEDNAPSNTVVEVRPVRMLPSYVYQRELGTDAGMVT